MKSREWFCCSWKFYLYIKWWMNVFHILLTIEVLFLFFSPQWESIIYFAEKTNNWWPESIIKFCVNMFNVLFLWQNSLSLEWHRLWVKQLLRNYFYPRYLNCVRISILKSAKVVFTTLPISRFMSIPWSRRILL